jgi:LuxR family maltose regulon positive regulatory protein
MTATGAGPELLRIKTHGPALPQDLVRRGRLLERAANLPLPGVTLVVAPAGFGKTTLASEWLGHAPMPAVWLGLDERDRDPEIFTRNLVSAVREIAPGFGEATLSRLRSGFDQIAIAQRLADDLLALGHPLLLLLDDYHDAASPALDVLLGHLVRWQPPGLHLFIDSRVMPEIPLSRARALGLVTDIGPEDLRFSRQEIAAFLRSHDQRLPEPVDDLSERTWQLTEGWPVVLRLFTLAVERRPPGDIRDFAAHRPVREYLIDEVLDARPAADLEMLLRLAVPERIDAALCQRLCGLDYPSAVALLDRLAWSDRLLTPIEHGEYRYHALIRETFRDRLLAASGPEAVAEVHRSVAADREKRNDILGAVTHLRAAREDAAAAAVIGRHLWRALDEDRRFDIDRWIRAMPEPAVTGDPALMLGRAVGLSFRGNEPGSEICLDAAEALLAAGAGPLDARERARLAAAIDVLHAENFRWVEDHEEQIRRMRAAADLMGDDRSQTRTDALSWAALALHALGRTDDALAMLDAVDRPDAGAPDTMTARIAMIRAGVNLFAMRPDRAVSAARRAIRHADEIPLESIRIEGRALLGLAHLYRMDLEESEAALRLAMANRSRASIFFEHESTLGHAMLLHLTGRGAESVALVEQYIAQTADVQDVRWQAGARSFRARLAALQGDHHGAREWQARFRDLRTEVPWRMIEAPEVTAIHVGLAAGGSEEVAAARDRLPAIIAALDADHDPANAIRARLLLGLALQEDHRGKAAIDPVRQAVEIALPGGVLQPFAELILPLRRLLRAAGRDGERIAAAAAAALAGPAPGSAFAGNRLSRRERQVLECLRDGLTNKEIADLLSISPATVKRHTIEIYRKLGVDDRLQAVEAARSRGLLGEVQR